MKRPFTALLRLLGALLCCWPCALPSHAQPLPDRRTLHGAITSAEGRPLGGADITFRRQDDDAIAQFWGAYAVSDARGEFTVPDMEEGAYYVDVTADGYAPVNSYSLVLEPASPLLRFKLVHLVPLILRVLKPDGTPFANTSVLLRISGGEGVGTRLPRATTDSKGQIGFNLTNNDMPNCPLCQLVPSHYAINVIAPGVGFAVVKGIVVQSATNPGTVAVQLQVGGGVRVTTKAMGGAERPLGGALLSMTPLLPPVDATHRQGIEEIPEDTARFYTLQRDPSGASLVTRDGDGLVELNDLPPGDYRVRVFAPNQDIPEPQDVTIKAGTTAQVDFSLKPLALAGALAITALDGKQQAMANQDFVAQLQPLNGAGASDTLGSMPPLPPGAPAGAMNYFYSGFLRRAQSDAKGQFTLYPLKPGKYRMRVTLAYDTMQIYAAQQRGARMLPTATQDITIPETGGLTAVTLKFDATATVTINVTTARRLAIQH